MWKDALEQADLLDPEQFITVREAAGILGVDRKTVGRYHEAGKLPGRRTADGISFRRWDVLLYREYQRDREHLAPFLKLAYAFDAFGCLEHANYTWNSPENSMDIRSGLKAYGWERNGILSPLHVESADVFMLGEVLARLHISDPHVVYHMVEDGVLEPVMGYRRNGAGGYERLRRGRNGGERLVITKDSFGEYLGPRRCERFYNSAEVASEIGIPVNAFDKRLQRLNAALQVSGHQPYGMKMNPNRTNSNYLFTLGDLCELRNEFGPGH